MGGPSIFDFISWGLKLCKLGHWRKPLSARTKRRAGLENIVLPVGVRRVSGSGAPATEFLGMEEKKNSEMSGVPKKQCVTNRRKKRKSA